MCYLRSECRPSLRCQTFVEAVSSLYARSKGRAIVVAVKHHNRVILNPAGIGAAAASAEVAVAAGVGVGGSFQRHRGQPQSDPHDHRYHAEGLSPASSPDTGAFSPINPPTDNPNPT